MGFWPFERRDRGIGEPPDYFREGLELASQKKHHEALTSFRLALRDRPGNAEIMQQMALVYTHVGMLDEAVRYYEEAIQTGGHVPGAHYGLAFLRLRAGDEASARRHLIAFLNDPPADEALSHIEHARETLSRLRVSDPPEDASEERAEDES